MREAFDYTETDDQLTAIREIKADMEKPVPMDRLLCGDVGYGKTEWPSRARHEVHPGRQAVALLVPTTVLAQQHMPLPPPGSGPSRSQWRSCPASAPPSRSRMLERVKDGRGPAYRHP